MPASESAAPHLAGTTFDVANLSAPTGIAPAGDISTVAAAEAPGRLRPIRRNFPPIEEAPESEFAPLGTGHDLTGWVVQDGQSQAWKASDGIVRCARGNGGWLRTEQEFGNFELRFDVCIGDGANTGVAFRFPGTGSPTLSGIELQLIDDRAEKYASLRPDQHTGSLYYLLPPLEYHPLVPGEWHAVQLLVRGDHIRITVDGTMVNETFLDQLPAGEKPHPLRTRPKTGHIGLQCSASEVQFRRLRIRDLTQE